MDINGAIQLTKSCADLLEFDPMTGEPTPSHRLEYKQAQGIRMVLAELETTKANQRWIPVEESLPEEVDGESKAVLAVVQLTDFNGLVYSENYQIVWSEEGEWACRGKVTHWMPLPEPPGKKLRSMMLDEEVNNNGKFFVDKSRAHNKEIQFD